MEQEVQQRLESLEGSLRTALRRISELEDELGAHYGLDYGTTLVDANSPHRNLSVDTIESGGGIILQSEHGMQVKSESNTNFAPSIYFVRGIVPDPSTSFPQSRIEGRETTTAASLQIVSANNDVSFNAVASTSAQSTGGFITLTAGPPGSDIPARLTVTRRADEAYVQVDGPLYLLDLSEDPSSIWGATEKDGMLWYRSDTDKFRARINGATENLATETLVTDHTGDTSDAHDASAISVDSTTLVGVGTDVQAVLEELDNGIADHLSDTSDAHDASAISVADSGGLLTATDVEAALAEIIGMIPAGGGGMSLLVKEADETVNNSATLQADNEILFAVGANEVYQFEGVIFAFTNQTADFNMQFTGPTGSVGTWGAVHNLGAAHAAIARALGASGSIDNNTLALQVIPIRFWGGIHNGGTAGNLTLEWAQNTMDASDTKVLAGSYIKWQLET